MGNEHMKYKVNKKILRFLSSGNLYSMKSNKIVIDFFDQENS